MAGCQCILVIKENSEQNCAHWCALANSEVFVCFLVWEPDWMWGGGEDVLQILIKLSYTLGVRFMNC